MPVGSVRVPQSTMLGFRSNGHFDYETQTVPDANDGSTSRIDYKQKGTVPPSNYCCVDILI